MVKKYDNNEADDIEITNEPTESTASTEEDLEVTEEYTADTIKDLRAKLRAAEEAKRDSLEELQRQKADFLNAKRRLEEDKHNDRQRSLNKHIELLLPLCDSFYLAQHDTETWSAVDEKWRKGVEGIYNQLQNLLASYQVHAFDPTGHPFDPNRQEAISNVQVYDEAAHDTVVNVVQLGYERINETTTDVIRPARVVVGEYSKEQN